MKILKFFKQALLNELDAKFQLKQKLEDFKKEIVDEVYFNFNYPSGGACYIEAQYLSGVALYVPGMDEASKKVLRSYIAIKIDDFMLKNREFFGNPIREQTKLIQVLKNIQNMKKEKPVKYKSMFPDMSGDNTTVVSIEAKRLEKLADEAKLKLIKEEYHKEMEERVNIERLAKFNENLKSGKKSFTLQDLQNGIEKQKYQGGFSKLSSASPEELASLINNLKIAQ